MSERRSALDRVKDWLVNPTHIIHTQDVAWLIKEVESVREYKGDFWVAHARYTQSSQEAGRLAQENAQLRMQVDTMNAGTDLPLWRRIAMQRMALRAMTTQVRIYEKLWREAVDKLKQDR